jgi:hypothetical protein
MIAPGNGLIQAVFAVAFVIASGYALGRIHQWYRDGVARDEAYRSGYDRASDCMLTMALGKQADSSGAVPAIPPGAVRPGDTPPRVERLIVATSAAGEAPPARQLVGHARRRIVAGRLTCAAPGNATP